jgi:hypothetical protein
MSKEIEKYLSKATKQQLNEGLNWYKNINRYCRDLGERYNLPTYKVAAIMSILSPRTSFANNVHDTEKLIQYRENANLRSPLFKDKALRVFDTNSYEEAVSLFNENTGRKTLSFFENIMLIGNRATIDTHMIKFFNLGNLTPKKYREAEKIIQDYALKVNLKPREIQAMLWVIIRGKAF